MKKICLQEKQMAGSTPLVPSSVPVSGLKDRVLGKNQQSPSSNNRFMSLKNKMSSNNSPTGLHSKTGDHQVVNPISRKSSVFTIENLLAPSIKSSGPVSPPNRTTSSPTDSTSPAAFNASEMVQQQLQYHHQNLFHHQHLMPLGLADPSAYGYTYLG